MINVTYNFEELIEDRKEFQNMFMEILNMHLLKQI